MAEPRFVTITVNVDTGEVSFSHTAGVGEEEIRTVGESVEDEIKGIKRGKKRYLRVGEILQTTDSPGCVYWNGVRWVKFC